MCSLKFIHEFWDTEILLSGCLFWLFNAAAKIQERFVLLTIFPLEYFHLLFFSFVVDTDAYWQATAPWLFCRIGIYPAAILVMMSSGNAAALLPLVQSNFTRYGLSTLLALSNFGSGLSADGRGNRQPFFT